MSTILKFTGGIILGSALGVGLYVVVTQDSEVGIIAGAKEFLDNVVDSGKQAAEARRTELEIELGQTPDTQAEPAITPASD